MEETKEWNIIDCSYREEISSSIRKINAKRGGKKQTLIFLP